MGDQHDSRSWDAEAEGYDEAADHGLHDPAVRRAWQDLLLRHLPEPPATVADLGCGTGTLAVLLAGVGFTVHGVDFSAAMLRAAESKAGRADVDLTLHRLTLHRGDAADPPLPPASVDAVLCRHVLWALPEPVLALRRWQRLLRPRGRLVLVEGLWGTGAGLPAAEVERLLRATGRRPTTHPLTDPTLWGGPISDQRYLVTA